MAWKMIEGFKYPYRISEEGQLQRWDKDHWRDIRAHITSHRKVEVKMMCADGKRRGFSLVRLMADAWLGGRRDGMCLVHKNGCKLDCGVRNLEWRTFSGAAQLSKDNRRRPVVKIDKSGCVVEIYGSIKEAAEANHISIAAMNMRCMRKVADPRRLDGYDYQYEDEKPGRPSK